MTNHDRGPLPSAIPTRKLRGVAGAISAFWADGEGPSHASIDGILSAFASPEDLLGSKAVKVRTVLGGLVETPDDFWELAQELLDTLDAYFRGFPPPDDSPNEWLVSTTSTLRDRLAGAGRSLSGDGAITVGIVHRVAGTIESVPACREQIDRLHRASLAADGPQVLGVAKDLIESTVHVVLRERGIEIDPEWKLPRRAKEAEKALLLHSRQHSDQQGDAGHHVGQILRSLHTIADSTVQLRNALGTGHGSAEPGASIPLRQLKLLAGSAILYSEMLLDTLQDPEAPWHRLG